MAVPAAAQLRHPHCLHETCPRFFLLPLPCRPPQEYVAAGLSTANLTLAAADEVERQLAAIRQRALDLSLDQLQPGVLQVGLPSLLAFSRGACTSHTPAPRCGAYACGLGGRGPAPRRATCLLHFRPAGRTHLALLAPPPLLPLCLQAIEDFHQSMVGVASGLQTATSDIQAAVLDRLEGWQQEWQPLADRLDVV